MMIILYLIIAAIIDYRTKRVYRIGSIWFIGCSLVMFASGVHGDLTLALEKLVSIFIFSAAVILQGILKLMGWGDVLTYIGVFFWMGSWEYDFMTIELLTVYMLLANFLFLIFNLPKLEWKKGKLKEEAAFLPAMAAAALFLWIQHKMR